MKCSAVSLLAMMAACSAPALAMSWSSSNDGVDGSIRVAADSKTIARELNHHSFHHHVGNPANDVIGNHPNHPWWDHCQPNVTSITCDASLDCDLRNGQVGLFVCRSVTNPMTGQVHSHPVCTPKDKAWTTDVCGCCPRLQWN